jgi:hypothetical protein
MFEGKVSVAAIFEYCDECPATELAKDKRRWLIGARRCTALSQPPRQGTIVHKAVGPITPDSIDNVLKAKIDRANHIWLDPLS